MSKTTRTEKKPIEQYDHKDKERCNNPPVDFVTPETDREGAKKTCAYDPHLTQISKYFFYCCASTYSKKQVRSIESQAQTAIIIMNSILFEVLKKTYESYTRPDT